MRSTKEAAQKRVAQFDAEKSSGVFTKIARSSVAAGLRARIEDPSKIDQASSSLCSAASLLFTQASTDPVAYVTLVIDLYEKGTTELGKRKITPGSDLKNYAPPSTINVADWIPMASIRDSENWLLDYESVDDQVAGITLPGKMVDWMKDVGYREVVDETNLVLTKGRDNLASAASLRNAAVANDSNAWWVFLFVNAQVLYSATQDDRSVIPNHWIVLLSCSLYPSSVQLEVFSWGQKLLVPRSGTLAISSFLKNYYGFIKCRY
jgi:hypothetical protein